MLWKSGRPSRSKRWGIQRSDERAGDHKLRQTFSRVLGGDRRCTSPPAQLERTRAELDQEELAVFRAFIGSDGPPGHPTNLVDSMMTCHGWYPCFDPTRTTE